MTKIIYSIFTHDVDTHVSCADYKRSQFKKYRDQIEESHRIYAKQCNADYILIETTNKNYDQIQFEKLFYLEEFSSQYNEILYLDFDVIPKTKISFFDKFDLNYLCFHAMEKTLMQLHREFGKVRKIDDNLKKHFKSGVNEMYFLDGMSPFIKMCTKKSMLFTDGINGKDNVINTGVIGGNKESISRLKIKDRMNMLDDKLQQAKEESIYPEEVSKKFLKNNEIYMSYLVERFQIPHIDIGLPWNYFLYEETKNPHGNNYFLHYIEKHFHCCFDSS